MVSEEEQEANLDKMAEMFEAMFGAGVEKEAEEPEVEPIPAEEQAPVLVEKTPELLSDRKEKAREAARKAAATRKANKEAAIAA